MSTASEQHAQARPGSGSSGRVSGGLAGRALAKSRYEMLAPHLHEEVPLAQLAAAQGEGGVSYRTLQRWLADYRQGGLDALSRPGRRDKGLRRFPDELVAFIEGLALRKPRPSAATIHRQAESIAKAHGWPSPAYRTVARIVADLDPALVTLGLEGTKKYRETYDLVYRREAKAPNEIWQADHTELDIWVLDDKGRPARPWLTAIEDDHSRAIDGYAVNLEAPSALTTALAFRHAIWRKVEPDWHVSPALLEQLLANPVRLPLGVRDVDRQPVDQLVSVGDRALPKTEMIADLAAVSLDRPARPLIQAHAAGRRLGLARDVVDHLVREVAPATRETPVLGGVVLQQQRERQPGVLVLGVDQVSLVAEHRPVVDQFIHV
ncbi:helix-turn-helix domain-containing protein [Nonomuraea sp. B19D2]|uniref:helix-turn-helix domain-containing protein n=1 Tax=Nonomuraea sp. B19D2 TaxID=3159561 RepID=UPI0032DB3DD5